MQRNKNLYSKRSLYSQLPQEKIKNINSLNARGYLAKRTLQYLDLITEDLCNGLLTDEGKRYGTRKVAR